MSDDSQQLETQSESDIEELNLFTERKSLAHVSPDIGSNSSGSYKVHMIRQQIARRVSKCYVCFANFIKNTYNGGIGWMQFFQIKTN